MKWHVTDEHVATIVTQIDSLQFASPEVDSTHVVLGATWAHITMQNNSPVASDRIRHTCTSVDEFSCGELVVVVTCVFCRSCEDFNCFESIHVSTHVGLEVEP